MKQILKQMRLDKNDYYETHLSIINCILPVKMTPMEIKVLSRFMGLDGDISRERFGTSARKLVKEELEIKPAGMSNYLRSLKDKGFITLAQGQTTILPILFPNNDEQEYLFKLVNLG